MSDLFDLKGRVALITGASSGLGVQFALALARQGADIAIAARRIEKLEEVKKQVEALGVKCLAVKCDVTSTDEIISMVNDTTKEFGKIDILVNNAGVATGTKSEDILDDEWKNIVDINLNSVFYVAREVGKVMIGNGYGRIINLGSIHSSVAMLHSSISAYAATKGGVHMLTKSLAAEWAKYGITVNTLAPAYFESEMTQSLISNDAFLNVVKGACPMGRTGKKGELDGALVYFSSESSSYTTGQILTVDGGWTSV